MNADSKIYVDADQPATLSSLFPCADEIDEAPPGDLGNETALVCRHAIIHHFPGEALHRFRCLAHVAGVKWRMRIVFDSQLDRFGSLATSDCIGQPKCQVDTC
jgi:hypothetical protein